MKIIGIKNNPIELVLFIDSSKFGLKALDTLTPLAVILLLEMALLICS